MEAKRILSGRRAKVLVHDQRELYRARLPAYFVHLQANLDELPKLDGHVNETGGSFCRVI